MLTDPRPLRRRRRPGLGALGVALTVVAAMTTWFVVSSMSDTVPVVAMRQGVQRGAQITNADVMTVEFLRDSPLAVVPGGQIDTVVGQVAQFELLPGQLLAPDDYGPRLRVPRGKAVLGVPLRRPLQPLRSGDQIRLVLGATPQGKIPDPLEAWDATVVQTVTVAGVSGEEFRVEVEVDAADADAVAAASATGRLVFTLVHPGAG